MNNIEKYFEGEKLQCTVGVIISIVWIALSAYFLFLQKPLLKGIAYPSIPLAILLLTICLSIIIRTPKDITRVTTFYRTETQKIRTDELPRMEKVMKNFVLIKRIEIVVFFLGLFMMLYLWKNDFLRGIAIGLMMHGAILYLFDHTAAARGKIYLEFLKSL